MEYIQYKIQKGDTLESIAIMHNTTVKDLVRFHNDHCGATQMIRDEVWPPYFSSIYIINQDSGIYTGNPLPKVSSYINNFVYNAQDSRLYDVHIKTSVIFLGREISENETTMQWHLDFNAPQHGYLNKKETGRKSGGSFPEIKIVSTVLGALNEASENLLFRLNSTGEIDAVVNNKEVQKRWKSLKEERLTAEAFNIPELTAMFKVCDEEFADLHTSLQNNILYTLFFIPTGKIALSKDETFAHLSDNKVLSQFFQPSFIPYSLQYHATEEDGNIKLHLISNIDKEQLMPRFEKPFKEKYAEISQIPQDFDYHIEGYYLYSKNGLLQQGRIFVREQVNLNCFYTATYEFKLINT
ncbi:MAG: LysM peptidoglycan-binding domain-containing protein [Chryseobacterium jejuense]|uniref:LysM peptidoglycan-binding domain-containing protein n=1 Tax=Chryseobacterium jejuense TaxID=445960 RepID=UPI003D0AF899